MKTTFPLFLKQTFPQYQLPKLLSRRRNLILGTRLQPVDDLLGLQEIPAQHVHFETISMAEVVSQ